MNSKICKKLRFVARQETIGIPARAYTTSKQEQIRLDSVCTHAAYKALKKYIRRSV